MTPMTIFIFVCVFWVTSEIVISVRRRSGVTGATKRDRLSLYVMWIAFCAGPFIGGTLTAVRSTGMGVGLRPYAFWVGIILMLTGIAIRWTAIATLKRYFTVDVAIARDHKVIDSGLYAIVRHPSYAGSLISCFGLGLAFCNWLSFAVVMLFAIVGIAYRIAVEEDALLDALGDDYRRYASRTKRLIPGIY
ncbi:MAG TPA: isoprenylcysteine carboxylmethyltransferase family protein [Thermoanaerobaculia bacterium]|nr:isoprenylcysteine carboxylmethyltransferase family protein [Thermoanaerobaculia bacterium]